MKQAKTLRWTGTTTLAASAACLMLLTSCVNGLGTGGTVQRGPTAGVQAVSPNDPNAVAPEGELPPNVLTIPDLPVPPGSQVVLGDTVIVGDDLAWTGQVVMIGDANQPVQVVEFMRRNMPEYGWIETAIVRSRRTSLTYVKGERFATVRVLPLEYGVEVDVVVAPAGRTAERATGTSTSSGGVVTITQ
ncbi:MAG: hypothetical protein R8L07_05285 [Alphaproteobacteria bacterium]|nr:hypothetical protein [Alphaproteobacteria bacterium]